MYHAVTWNTDASRLDPAQKKLSASCLPEKCVAACKRLKLWIFPKSTSVLILVHSMIDVSYQTEWTNFLSRTNLQEKLLFFLYYSFNSFIDRTAQRWQGTGWERGVVPQVTAARVRPLPALPSELMGAPVLFFYGHIPHTSNNYTPGFPNCKKLKCWDCEMGRPPSQSILKVIHKHYFYPQS